MKRLLILHGALGSVKQLATLGDALSSDYTVAAINLAGHGGSASDGQFSIEKFAADVCQWITENKYNKTSIIGYSLGGYVGMYMAKHYPMLIDKLVTISTKYHWDKVTAEKEVAMLNPALMVEKVPKYAKALQKVHHPQDWKILVTNTAALLSDLAQVNPLPLHEFKTIDTPTLLLLGDRDKTVTLIETATVFKELPVAQMGILPNTKHAFEDFNLPVLVEMIKAFL